MNRLRWWFRPYLFWVCWPPAVIALIVLLLAVWAGWSLKMFLGPGFSPKAYMEVPRVDGREGREEGN